ncbi:MAG: ABC transporter permease [Anaerolineales bacterium]
MLTSLFLALRNMRLRKMRTLLTCLGIVLGVAVILAIDVTNASTLDSLRKVFDEAAGESHLYITSSTLGGEGVEEKALGRVADTPGVSVAAPSVSVASLLAQDARGWQIQFGVGRIANGAMLQVLGVDPQIDPLLREYEITEGRWLRPDSYEAVLTAEYAAEKELAVGEDMVIVTPEGHERLRLVGLVDKRGAALLNDGVIAFVPLTTVQELFRRGGFFDTIDVKAAQTIAEDPDALEALRQRLTERLHGEYDVQFPTARGRLVTEMLSIYQQGLQFFSVVALFVGVFLIYNAFSMTVIERTREIGMLRSIGMSRRQILVLVLWEALSLGVAGSLFGVVVGVYLARGLIVLMSAVLAADLALSAVPATGVAKSVLVGLAVTVGAAAWPAWRAARTTPLEALQVQARPPARVGRYVWVAGLNLSVAAWAIIFWAPLDGAIAFQVGSAAVLALMFGVTLAVPAAVQFMERIVRPLTILLYRAEGRLGSGNVQRAQGRSALTVAALMIGIAMIIGISALTAAFKTDLNDWINTAIGGDIIVRSPVTMREYVGRELATVPGVTHVTPARFFSVRVAHSAIPPGERNRDNTLIFVAIEPQSYRAVGSFQFATAQGDPEEAWARLAQNNALFVSTLVADRYGLEQGDTLRLVTRRGEHDFTVAAIIVDFTGQGRVINGTWGDMRRWFGVRGVDRYTIKVAPGYNVEGVMQTIEDRYGERRDLTAESAPAFRERILQLADQSFALFDVLGLIGIVVAALGVINTLMMNVLERRREIGGLRSLGMTRWQVGKMVLAEAATLGAIGGAIGLAFGALLGRVFVANLNGAGGYDLTFTLPLNALLVGAAIALLVSQLAAFYPAWRAAGVNIVAAIKHE